jgi:hypothetical protein
MTTTKTKNTASLIVTFKGRDRAIVHIENAWNGERHLSALMALAEHVARTGTGIHASVPAVVVEGVGPQASLGIFRVKL